MQHEGRGTLFFPDGREWGEVEYSIDERPKTATTLGRIEGHLQPAGGPVPLPFFDFIVPNIHGALRLSDGRWWLCVFQNSDGRVLNRSGGIRPPGPQPQPD